jgi:hypothetical protein
MAAPNELKRVSSSIALSRRGTPAHEADVRERHARAQFACEPTLADFCIVCTVKLSHSRGSLHEFHQKSDRVNPSLRLRGDERELRRISDAIVILDPSGATCTESANGCGHIMISGRRSEVPKNNWPN